MSQRWQQWQHCFTCSSVSSNARDRQIRIQSSIRQIHFYFLSDSGRGSSLVKRLRSIQYDSSYSTTDLNPVPLKHISQIPRSKRSREGKRLFRDDSLSLFLSLSLSLSLSLARSRSRSLARSFSLSLALSCSRFLSLSLSLSLSLTRSFSLSLSVLVATKRNV